jgi:protein TonB
LLVKRSEHQIGPLALSSAIHIVIAGFYFVWILLSPIKHSETIEIEYIENKNKNTTTNTRIVESERVHSKEKPKEDAFLGAQDQTVVKETVKKAQNINEKIEPNKTMSPKRELAKLGVNLTKIIPVEESNSANNAGRYSESDPHDYVEGLNESERTLLNTKEFVFFGFFQRIKERLEMAWHPLLKEHLSKFYQKGRSLASDKDHKTELLVILNSKGEVVRVRLIEESGQKDLDNAAIGAFNKAGPFPNPPKGIMNAKGEVEIRWGFVLKT